MKVIRSRLLGYCHGVSDTINQAERCLDRAEQLNLPCYSIGNLIHNRDIVNYFSEKGLKVIKTPESEPGIALIRAHGISDKLKEEFENKGFTLVDSTCANIVHTKSEMKKVFNCGRHVVLVGVHRHAEVVGLSDCVPMDIVCSEDEAYNLCSRLNCGTGISVFVQTTFQPDCYERILSILLNSFKDVEVGNKLCPACIERNRAAEELCRNCEAIAVVGSTNSHNTMDLVKVIEAKGIKAFLVENAESISSQTVSELKKYQVIGLCSGTSAPKRIIDKVAEYLEAL